MHNTIKFIKLQAKKIKAGFNYVKQIQHKWKKTHFVIFA